MADPDAAELNHAANVLVRAPVRGKSERLVVAGQTFVIVADEKSQEIAAVLMSAAEALGATVSIMRLDTLVSVSTNHTGVRPHKVLPPQIRRAMMRAHASAYVASAPIQERPMREQFFGIVDACRVKHAHLPDITKRAFANGMRVDYASVVAAGWAMAQRLGVARTLECDSAAGTKLTATFSPESRWLARVGELVPGKSVTFPAGAIFASPEEVHGTFMANASVGEFFGAREGLLAASPVKLVIENGRVVKVEADSKELQGNIEAMLNFSSNSDRVGLVAVGVNAGLANATGEAIVDQNLPGMHIFIGDPASKATGATWSARTSFAVCQSGSRVLIDRRVAIEGGKIVDAL